MFKSNCLFWTNPFSVNNFQRQKLRELDCFWVANSRIEARLWMTEVSWLHSPRPHFQCLPIASRKQDGMREVEQLDLECEVSWFDVFPGQKLQAVRSQRSPNQNREYLQVVTMIKLHHMLASILFHVVFKLLYCIGISIDIVVLGNSCLVYSSTISCVLKWLHLFTIFIILSQT